MSRNWIGSARKKYAPPEARSELQISKHSHVYRQDLIALACPLELWIRTYGDLDERKMQARFKSELRERFGSKIKVKRKGVAFGNDGSATIVFLLEFSKDLLAGTLSGLFASWLYDLLKELRPRAQVQSSKRGAGLMVRRRRRRPFHGAATYRGLNYDDTVKRSINYGDPRAANYPMPYGI